MAERNNPTASGQAGKTPIRLITDDDVRAIVDAINGDSPERLALHGLLRAIEGYLLTGCKGGTPESDALANAMEKAENLVGEAMPCGAISYTVEIAEFNSAGIQAEAEQLGITHMRKIGGGYIAGHEGEADYYVGFYALPHPQGWEFLVANTNGDPVWQEADPHGFAELAESCGVQMTSGAIASEGRAAE